LKENAMPTDTMTTNTHLQGWRLTGWIGLALTAVSAALVASGGVSAESAQAVIRFTARTSLLLFCLAYSAAALARLWPNAWTRWQRQNRRYLGVSFAVSHAIHALAIVSFGMLDPVQFAAATSIGMYVSGGIAYAFIALMTLTSFDATARAIGPRAWRLLHVSGGFYIWVSFIVSFGRRIPVSEWYVLPVLLVVAVMIIRVVARFVVRAARPVPSGV
jgi:methionine sulfoxide reductase heme-binding subunit